MNVATLDKMQIELMVDESDIGQIKDGQTVEFTVDAYPDETFKGIISSAEVRRQLTMSITILAMSMLTMWTTSSFRP